MQRHRTAAAGEGPVGDRRSGRRRLRLVVLGTVVSLTVPAALIATSATASVVFNDGFETGSTSAWTVSSAARAQREHVASGAWAGQVSSTGSPSFLRKKLGSTTSELRVAAMLKVVSQGRNPVTLLTLGTATGGVVASVYVTANRMLAVRNPAAGPSTVSTTALPLGSWHSLSLAVRGGPAGRIDVALDGAAVAALSADVPVSSARMGQVEVGDTTRGRTYRIAVDDVATSGGGDSVAPTTPTRVVPLRARDAAAVTVAWLPSTDRVGVTGYDVYRDDVLVGTVGRHTAFRDAQVRPGDSHTYTVRARDAAGNASAASAPASVTVPPGPETGVAQPLPLVGTVVQANMPGYDDDLRARALEQAVATGLTWIRVGVQWSRIQPRQPTETDPGYDLAGAVAVLDRFVQRAADVGLKVNVVLNSTPNWANGGKGTKVLPTDPADYARVAQWAADRYRGTVQSWEVYNEPNLPKHTVATPESYAPLLCAAYAGFHSGNPAAVVVSGATAGNDWEWYQRLYAAQAKGCFDVLATHPYQAYSLPPDYPAQDGQRWWTDNVRLVRDVMVDNGDEAVPVWFTEFGWSTHDNPVGTPDREVGVSHQVQAEYTVDMVRKTVEEYPWVTRVAAYQMRDAAISDTHNANFGLYSQDMAPKPVATALRDFLATTSQVDPG